MKLNLSPNKFFTRWKKSYHEQVMVNQTLVSRIYVMADEMADLKRGNEILKKQHESLLLTQDSQLKTDLNEAINIIIDYQKTLFRLTSPDPNVQRANDFLNKWNLKSERVHSMYKIMAGDEDITMGREF